MNAQENIQIVQEGYRLFKNGDIENLLKLYTDDITFIFHGTSDLIPFENTFHGKKEVGQFFATVNDSLEFESYEAREFINHGDRVIVLGRDQSKTRSTGRPIAEEWVHVLTVRDGKTARLESYGDINKMMAGFGEAKHQEVVA